MNTFPKESVRDQKTIPPADFRKRVIRAIFVTVFGVFVVGVIVSGAFVNPYNYGKGDWLEYHQHDQSAITSILEFGQIPLWSPYTNGGIPYLAASHTNILTPFFLIKLIWGTGLGSKIQFSLQFLAGFLFMFFLARDMKIGWLLSLMPATLFSASAMIILHVGGGHLWAIPFVYYPGIVLGYRLSAKNLAWVPFPAILVALTVLEGGIYPFPFLIILFTFYTISACFGGFPLDGPFHLRPSFRPIYLTTIIFAAGIGLGSIKLIPQLIYLLDNPRVIYNYDQIPLSMAWDVFTSRHSSWGWQRLAFQNYKWWGEYSHFIGETGVILTALTIILRFRKYAFLSFLTLVFFLFMLGNHGSWTPYELLRKLPMYNNLRVPTRFGFLVAFHVVIIASLGLRDFIAYIDKFGNRKISLLFGKALVPLIAVFFMADVVIQNRQWMGRDFIVPEKGNPNPPIEEFRQVRTGRYGTHFQIRKNLGCPFGFQENPIPRSPKLKFGWTSQFWLLDAENGNAEEASWSPNKLEFEVNLLKATTLIINQNHYDGWHSSAGEITSWKGLLGVKLPAGASSVSVYFWPPGLTAGLILFSFSVLACLLLVVLAGRRALILTPEPGQKLTRRHSIIVSTTGPLSLVIIVILFNCFSQPSFDEICTDVKAHMSKHWEKGDVMMFYPPCIGPSCRKFSDFPRVRSGRIHPLKGKPYRRLWYFFNRPAFNPSFTEKMKRHFNNYDKSTFTYVDLYLFEGSR